MYIIIAESQGESGKTQVRVYYVQTLGSIRYNRSRTNK